MYKQVCLFCVHVRCSWCLSAPMLLSLLLCVCLVLVRSVVLWLAPVMLGLWSVCSSACLTMLSSSLRRGDAFCGFCQCSTCTPTVYIKCVCVCADEQSISQREPMEAAYPCSATLCMLMCRKVDRHYSSSARFLQLDRSRTDGNVCHISAGIPPQSSLRSRMTFQLRCHFYWFSCCVGEVGGWGGGGAEAIEREGAREGKWEKALVPQYQQKMEPVSALHACVLEMTLKSSCNQTGYPRLSLRGNSEERDSCTSAPTASRGEWMWAGRREGKEARGEGRTCGLSLTLLSPRTPRVHPLCFDNYSVISLASAPGLQELQQVSLWLAPFPHFQHLWHHLRHHPPQPVSHPTLADWQCPCLPRWGSSNLNRYSRIFVRATALCYGSDMSVRVTERENKWEM